MSFKYVLIDLADKFQQSGKKKRDNSNKEFKMRENDERRSERQRWRERQCERLAHTQFPFPHRGVLVNRYNTAGFLGT